jgi:hypothetical protein
MEIIALPVKNSKILHKWLPPSHLMITAPTSSGKTVLLINMIARKSFPYHKYYKTIHVFSPTINTDNNWNLIKQDKTNKYMLHENLDIEHIYELVDTQDADIMTLGKNKVKHQLLIIDDFAGEMKNSNNRFLIGLLMKLRHSNIHLWLTTQSYRAIPRPMRLQFQSQIIFRVSPNELDVISSELNGSLQESLFKEMYLSAITDRPYNFMYINIAKAKYYSGFLHQFKIKEIETTKNENIKKENIAE